MGKLTGGLLLLLILLLYTAIKYMGILTGILYFVCALLGGVFVFLLFCAAKEQIEQEDYQEENTDWQEWP